MSRMMTRELFPTPYNYWSVSEMGRGWLAQALTGGQSKRGEVQEGILSSSKEAVTKCFCVMVRPCRPKTNNISYLYS